jgi:EmrB/QacA subfamily drug resistance transporter
VRELEERTKRGGASGRLEYKWIVLSVTTIGALMAAIDGNIVILALPAMMVSLHADLVQMIWVIMSYILVSSVILLALGRAADMLGRVRMYNWGFVTFTVGSVLCGISRTGVQLILARMVQGAGGAMMVVNSAALLTEVFPPNERGKALGINGITFSAGGVLGPVLGGLILAATSWRWIFFINVPIGIVGTIWSIRSLREISPKSEGERFDFLGALAFSVGLLALLAALTLGIQAGWTSPPILGLFALFLAMFFFFIWQERRVPNPVLDFSLFKSRVFSFSTLAAMMQSLAMFAVSFLIVFYLQAVRGYDPLKAALLLIPMPIVMAVVAPMSGMLADRVGARIPATIGVLIGGAALLLLLSITPYTSYLSIATGLALMGLGGGLFYPSNTSSAMNAAPRNRLGIASAALATLRQVGMVTSLALAMAVAAGSLPRDDMMKLFVGTNIAMGSASMQAFVVGMRGAFAVSLGLSLAAAVLSFVRGKESRRLTVAPEIAAECESAGC